MGSLKFVHQNPDWNAEPGAPALRLSASGDTLTLTFYLNPWAYDAAEEEVGHLTFNQCSRWRRDDTNDEAWFGGKGRFCDQAPSWGEFYEIVGFDPSMGDYDWHTISDDQPGARHFLFYFKDEAIECVAGDWSLTRENSKDR